MAAIVLYCLEIPLAREWGNAKAEDILLDTIFDSPLVCRSLIFKTLST
jgi:hypothetical protein